MALVKIAPPRGITWQMIYRIVADAVLVNVALGLAFATRLLATLWMHENGVTDGTGEAVSAQLLHTGAAVYLETAPLLTLFCLAFFTMGGFYTYGRTYKSRYKALIILQSVSVAYIAFGALNYVFLNTGSDVFPATRWFPRSVWISGWFFTLVLVGGARFWSHLWRRTVWTEAKIQGKPKQRAIRNVLVIGGAGYIGSVLVRKLLDRGLNVSVLDALVYGDEGIRDLYTNKNFELIKDDFRNIESVFRALQHCDGVIHLGALVGDPACALDEQLTKEINLAATRMIAEAARGSGVRRFVFASTCSVYGAGNHVLDEKSVLNPVSLYARTKMDSERVVLDLETEEFSPTVLRFATVYGMSPRPRFDLVINLLSAMAQREKKVSIFGGNQWRPFIHVSDLAEALCKVLFASPEAVKGEVLNVGSDEQNYQIADLGPMFSKQVPGTEVIEKGDDLDPRNYRVSFAKLKRQVGFTPQFSVEDGIKEIVESVSNRGRLASANFRDAQFSNLKTLSEGVGIQLIKRTEMTPLYSGTGEHPPVNSGLRQAPAA